MFSRIVRISVGDIESDIIIVEIAFFQIGGEGCP